jgi:hypothetical protein
MWNSTRLSSRVQRSGGAAQTGLAWIHRRKPSRLPAFTGQPRLPAHHPDPHPLRPADLLSRRTGLRLHGHRRRRRPLPALLQHQDETRGPRSHRRRALRADRRAAAAGAPALPRRRPGAVPPAERQPQRAQAHLQPYLPQRARPLAGSLRHPRRARAARAPNPPSMEAHAGHGPSTAMSRSTSSRKYSTTTRLS